MVKLHLVRSNARKVGETEYLSDSVLGSPASSQKFHEFFTEHSGDLECVKIYLLSEYLSTGNRSSEGYGEYYRGIEDVLAFLQLCSLDVSKKNEKSQEREEEI